MEGKKMMVMHGRKEEGTDEGVFMTSEIYVLGTRSLKMGNYSNEFTFFNW
jgi:hypothetical protein